MSTDDLALETLDAALNQANGMPVVLARQLKPRGEMRRVSTTKRDDGNITVEYEDPVTGRRRSSTQRGPEANEKKRETRQKSYETEFQKWAHTGHPRDSPSAKTGRAKLVALAKAFKEEELIEVSNCQKTATEDLIQLMEPELLKSNKGLVEDTLGADDELLSIIDRM